MLHNQSQLVSNGRAKSCRGKPALQLCASWSWILHLQKSLLTNHPTRGWAVLKITEPQALQKLYLESEFYTHWRDAFLLLSGFNQNQSSRSYLTAVSDKAVVWVQKQRTCLKTKIVFRVKKKVLPLKFFICTSDGDFLLVSTWVFYVH